MKKVKITILKTTLQEDLAKEYGVDGLSTCPLMNEGQVFYADYAKPDGFCDEAWKAIYQYVFALAHEVSDIWYYKDWIKTPEMIMKNSKQHHKFNFKDLVTTYK